MSTLRLFLDDSSFPLTLTSEVAWRLLDTTGHGRGKGLLSSLPSARRLEVYLPPALALRSTITLPPGGRRQARKLLAHALDPILLGDPAAQHLAFSTQGDLCRVTAVERSVVADLMAALGQQRLRPQAIYVADALIPADGQTLLWYHNGWARRLPDGALWFDANSPTDCPALLAGLLSDLPHLNLALPDAEGDSIELSRWHAATGIDVFLNHGDAFSASVQADALNLLQGEFATGPQLDIDLNKLKPAGMLALAAAVLLMLTWFGQWISWRNEEKALNGSMESAYAAAFPKEPALESALLQQRLQKKLQGATSSSADDPLAKLAAIAGSIHAPDGVKLMSLEFNNSHIDAEYLGKQEQLAGMVQALGSNAQVQTNPVGPDRVHLNITPHS